MSEVTRDEIDAKIAAAEARLETGLARMEGKFDAGLSRMEGKLDAGLLRMEGKFDTVVTELTHVVSALKDTKEEARLAKVAASAISWNIGFTVLTAVAALIAVILTMWTITYQVADTVRSVNPPIQSNVP